jgi:hypothetical protein
VDSTRTEFCAGCKQLIDYALATPLRHKLYIEINPEVEPPDGRAAIPLCEECKTKLMEELGIDGFVIEIP